MSLPNKVRAHFHVDLDISVITEEGVIGNKAPAGYFVLASTMEKEESDEGLGLYIVGHDIDLGEEAVSFVQPAPDYECSAHPSLGPCGGRMTLATDATLTTLEEPPGLDGF